VTGALWKSVRGAPAAVALILSGTVGAVVLSTLHPAYDGGDDPTMALITMGLHGAPPSERLVFSHVVVGASLRALYARASAVNWHALYLYLVLGLALAGLFRAMLGPRPTLRALACCAAVATIALPYWVVLQFTTVAIWAAWSGGWLVRRAGDAPAGGGRGMWIAGVGLLVVASLIRVEATVVGVALMAPWLLDGIWPARSRRVLSGFAVAGVLAGVAMVVDREAYARPEWRAWLRYNRIRAELYDRPLRHLLATERPERLALGGWTRNDAQLFERGVFFDPDIYSGERIERVTHVLGNRFPDRQAALRQLGKRSPPRRLAVTVGLPLVLCLCFGARRGAFLVRAALAGAAALALALHLERFYKVEQRYLMPITDALPVAAFVWLSAPPLGIRRRPLRVAVVSVGAVAALA